MWRSISALSILMAVVVVAVCAQTPSAFEVAIVHASEGPIPGIPLNLGQQRTTANTLTARNTARREIIQRAYGIGPPGTRGTSLV